MCMRSLHCTIFLECVLLAVQRNETHGIFFNFFKGFIYFLDGKGGRKRERNINVWVPLVPPPTGDLVCNPGMCPDWESNHPPFVSQAGAQSTEQPGGFSLLMKTLLPL